MHFFGAGFFQHFDEAAAYGTANQTVIHQYHAFAFHGMFQNIEFDAGGFFALSLVGFDKGTADIAVFDTEVQYKVNPEEFVSMGKSTPFEGWHLWGECCLTMVDGKIVWQR